MALNYAVLVGRLTGDPELKKTQSGISVTSFTIAVDRRHKAGEEKTADFINCIAWRQAAEFVTQYFKKGKPIQIVGSIQTRSYTDQSGKKRYATEIVANDVSFAETERAEQTPQTQNTPYVPDAYQTAGAENDPLPF